MKRLLIFTVIIATLSTTVAAFAATLSVGADDLAAGDAPIKECDNSFGHSFTTSGGNVTEVTVTDIADPACAGGQLSLTLTDSGGAGIGQGGPVAVSGSSVTVSINPQPAASSVAGIHIVVVGP